MLFVRVSNVVPSCCLTVVMCDKGVLSDVVNCLKVNRCMGLALCSVCLSHCVSECDCESKQDGAILLFIGCHV